MSSQEPVVDQAEVDRQYLLRAIALAADQVRTGAGGPFGAVIVKDGSIIAEGGNEVTATFDPTAHAEVVAIRRACRSRSDFSLAGATIYASCEPCPMCLGSIYWARLDRLVFSNTRGEAAAIGFDDALIYDEIPKALADRQLPTLHLPLAEGAEAFADWMRNPAKIAY